VVLGAIWENPILIFIIISLISWFFGRDKTAGQQGPDPAPRPVESDREVSESREERPTIQRSNTDDDIRRKIQERERQLQKKLSQAPELEREASTLAQSIKEQYERQKAKLAGSEAKEKRRESTPEPVVSVPVQMVKSTISKDTQPKKSKEPSGSERTRVNLQGADLRQAVIMSEILGPPRSKRRHIR